MRNTLNLCRCLILSVAVLFACAGTARAADEPPKVGLPPPETSILDSLDDGRFRDRPVADSAACPACAGLVDQYLKVQADLESLEKEAAYLPPRIKEAELEEQRLNLLVAGAAAEVKAADETHERGDIVSQRFTIIDVAKTRGKLEAFQLHLQGLLDQLVHFRAALTRIETRIYDTRSHLRAIQGQLDTCNRSRCAPRAGGELVDPPPKPAVSAGCSFDLPKPIVIGPRATYGYTDELKAAEFGKAVAGFLGGLLGGRGGMGSSSGGMGGGPIGPSGGDGKPSLIDDPVRDKQTFTDPQTGTVIKVGSSYRPDGKLLVSVNVDTAEDKGVVHQATMERVQYLPSGKCGAQAIEPVEWLHYEIWEDWWAKIRIRKYESVGGGPWRQTADTGWRDWGSGSRLLQSGTMSADQIPGTAWGSMGADRAFGGPRSAGAVFDAGKPVALDKPAPERLVVHISQPGKDPVTTVPFALYPTYGTGGKVTYADKAPDMSGGMQRIDPPATAPAQPEGSILDSIDSGVGKTPIR